MNSDYGLKCSIGFQLVRGHMKETALMPMPMEDVEPENALESFPRYGLCCGRGTNCLHLRTIVLQNNRS
jgi:hypothetical protein